MFKRIVSLLLAMVLLAGSLTPMTVGASETEAVPAAVEETTHFPEETAEASEAETLTETTAVPTEETEEETAAPTEEIAETVEATAAPTEETVVPTEETAAPEEETTVPETEEAVTEETELPDASEELPMVPEGTVVTTYVQRDYGFDLVENPYDAYRAQYDMTPCAEGAEPAAAVLPTPSSVTWNQDTYGWIDVTFPSAVNLSTVIIDVIIYRNGEYYRGGGWWLEGTAQAGETITLDFVPEMNDSGTFYCTVQLAYRNGSSGAGGIATSGNFVFTLPSAKLSTPKGLRWSEGLAKWDAVSNAVGYYVHWNSQFGTVSGSWFVTGDTPRTSTSIPTENSGLTKFKVRALADLKSYKHSDESGWSDYNGNALKTDVTSYSDNVKYYSEVTNSNRSVHLDYEDSFFSKSSYSYDHDLARASLKLAMSAFASAPKRKGGVDGDARNAYDYLEKIGCNPEFIKDYDYNIQPTEDSIAYVIGSKYLKEEKCTLIVVAIRGQGYKTEWAGNFRVGPSLVYHQGFESAAGKVLSGLNTYISNNKHISGKVKLWITGYSRAAATANILAGKLDNGDAKLVPKVSLDPKDLFAYTFETPAGVKSTGFPHSEKYKNIYNIINETDFVTKVAPSAWSYKRFGVDCFLPDMSKKDNSAVAAKYKALVGKDYVKPFKGSLVNLRQSLYLDWAMDEIAVSLGGETGYYALHQHNLRQSCIDNQGMPGLDALFHRWLPVVAVTNADIVAMIVANASAVKFGHFPENCLAFMETMEGEGDFAFLSKYKYYIVKCPVDVAVTDDAGNVIASIENDTVTQLGNENVEVFVDKNGEKHVFILDDSSYTLQLTATDNGEMDCTVVTYDKGEGKTAQSAFFDVPLVVGESYEAPFSVEDDNYQLIGEEEIFTPDVQVSGGQMYNTPVTAEVVGGGTVSGTGSYTIGDTASLMAHPNEDHVFAGWYQNGELITREESYCFSVREDVALTAVFLSTNVTMTLDREYLAILCEAGQTVEEQLVLTVNPSGWEEFVTWSVEASEENANVLSVNENGTVTIQGPGMAYVVATASFKGYTFTTRCRFDVTEESIAQQIQNRVGVNGVVLGTKAVTTELYSADYAAIETVLVLPQNMSAASIGQEAPVDNGAAIAYARFTDPEAAKLFDLVVKDDRTLLIVPTETAFTAKINSSYSSTVTVSVEGTEFVTADALKLSVKKTLPKLKAAAVTLNSFYLGDSAMLSVTGGNVTEVWVDTDKKDACPQWLEVDRDGTIRLKEAAPQKGTAKVQLLADVEGWTVPVALTADVKLSRSAPSLKLSASAITLQEDYTNSQGVQLQLVAGKSVSLEDLQIEGITVSEGYSIQALSATDGTFLLMPEAAPVTGTVRLGVRLAGAAEEIPLTVKVKVAPVQLKLGSGSITLGYAAPYSVPVKLTVDPADYLMGEPVIRVTDKTGKIEYGESFDMLEFRYQDGILYVGSTLSTWSYKGDTYKVWISPYEGGKETALTVKLPAYNKTAITYTAKATGTIDLSYPASQVIITSSFKNYLPQGSEDFGYSITAQNGKENLGDVTDLFAVSSLGNGQLAVKEKTPGTLNAKYTYTIRMSMITESLYQVAAPAMRLPVKQTAVKLKLDKSSIKLNPTILDPDVITVATASADYDLTDPMIWVTDGSGKNPADDMLDLRFADNQLTVRANEQTQPGGKYKIHIQAGPGHPAATVAVTILTEAKSAVTAKQKVTGTLDVIRSSTGIVVEAPVFSGYNGATQYTQSHRILAVSGKTVLGDYTDRFSITENGENTFLIRSAGNVDPALKYVLRTEVSVPKADGTALKVTLPDTALKITMGSAKFSADVKSVQLYAKDKNSVGVVTMISGDRTLNNIASVRIKQSGKQELFTLEDFGGGQYAICFASGQAAVKGGNVVLEIFLEGNMGTKPNATVSVKVNIV